MSSTAKATARPLSTIRNDSEWPLADTMFMPRLRAAFSSVICLMFVVPAVDTMVLPFMSSSLRIFEAFFATRRLAVTKVVTANHTCFWRSRLLGVEPHSRSMVPFAISGMRFAEVTSWYLTSSFGIFSSALSASTTRAPASTARPTGRRCAPAGAASPASARPKAGVMLFSLRCVEFAPGILTPSRAPGHGPHALGHRREQRGRELGPGLHQVQEHLAVEREQRAVGLGGRARHARGLGGGRPLAEHAAR